MNFFDLRRAPGLGLGAWDGRLCRHPPSLLGQFFLSRAGCTSASAFFPRAVFFLLSWTGRAPDGNGYPKPDE
jgi:hypothetical protein